MDRFNTHVSGGMSLEIRYNKVYFSVKILTNHFSKTKRMDRFNAHVSGGMFSAIRYN